METIYSTQWIRKIKQSYNDVDCLIYGQINTIIRIEDSNANELLVIICTRINDQLVLTSALVYLYTLDALIIYYLKLTGNWYHIRINYLLVLGYNFLNLDVEATLCLSLKHINTLIHMTPNVKYVIKIK